MEDVYYLPPGAGEGFYFTINPFDEERYMKVVDKAAESGDRMSSCRYGNISGEFTLDVECSEGLDELSLEILYGDRIRKTTERLNNEWLKKMWKASDDDFRVFWFEQIRKKFEEHEDQNGLRWQADMRRHHNPNKVPPFKPDPEHWTRKVHSWKAKVAYETEDDAWEFLNQIPRLKTLGWHPYLCKVCSKWHIGRLHNK